MEQSVEFVDFFVLCLVSQWKIPVLRLFVKHGYYCIVLNRLGFGKYSDEEEEWAADYYQQHTADFLAFLDALHIKRCAVVSWCDGANISLMAAAQRPTAFGMLNRTNSICTHYVQLV